MQLQVNGATMLKSLKKTLQLPLHPWIIGAVPILFLYSQNFGLVIDNEVPALVFWVLMVTTIGYLAAFAISRNIRKAALITSSVMVLFSLSGHFHSLVAHREPLIVWTALVLITMAIAVAELRSIRSERFFEQVTLPLNLVSLALILAQIAALYSHYTVSSSGQLTIQNGEAGSASEAPGPKVQDSADRPDIYYIIPDRYPSDGWLQSAMGYDNSMFTEALKARGFEVVPHAQANYASTMASLATTLNMRHINTNPSQMNDLDFLRHSIANSEVARYLLRLGYTYVQLLSGHLIPSSIADINRDFTPGGPVDISIDENDLATVFKRGTENRRDKTEIRRFYQQSLTHLYLWTSLFKPIAYPLYRSLQLDQTISYHRYAPERFLDTVEEISSVAAMPEATFTFVHLLKPHQPAVFDRHGNTIEQTYVPSRRAHLAEFEFVNRKFLEMIDTILEASRRQPIIIFQADHGSMYGVTDSADNRLIHFDLYFAYYLPDLYSLDIPRPHTNINTFPLILNAVFDAGFDFQENRLIELLDTSKNISAQEDVTEIFAHR